MFMDGGLEPAPRVRDLVAMIRLGARRAAAVTELEKKGTSMKIISKFRDYYDYVGHVYGESDSRWVYNRHPFEKPPVHPSGHQPTSIEVTVPGYLIFPELHDRDRYSSKAFTTEDGLAHYYTEVLCVAGTVYAPIGRKRTDPYRAIVDPRYGPDNDDRSPTLFSPKHTFMRELEKRAAKDGKELDLKSVAFRSVHSSLTPYRYNLLDRVHRAVKAPVFKLLHYRHPRGNSDTTALQIDCNIPILQEYGFSGVVDPLKLFQEIEYYLVNVMQDSPDTMPPTTMTDKEKIVAAGFDTKQSFRHRK